MSCPRPAVRAAVAKATRWARDRPGILSVGMGFKHSQGGYDDDVGLCVKVLVDRKRPTPGAPVPDHFEVVWQGQPYRIRTDVEESAGLEQQSLPCFSTEHPEIRGTVGGFIEDSAGQLSFVTAGHVFESSADGAQIHVAGRAVGAVSDRLTAFFSDMGFCDISAVVVNTALDPERSQSPWSSIRSVTATAQLWRHLPAEGQSQGRVHGTGNVVEVQFDTLYSAPVAWKNILYAPPLLAYRVVRHTLADGDSGAAVTDAASQRWLGIHVLGRSDYGMAQGAARMLFELGQRVGSDLHLAH